MRRAVGTRGKERTVRREEPGDAVDDARLEALPLRERGEDGGEGAREERLPGPRRAYQEDVVAARCRELEGALRALLPRDVREVDLRDGRGVLDRDARRERERRAAREVADHLAEVCGAAHARPGNRSRLRRVLGGDDDVGEAAGDRVRHAREAAAERPQHAVERELAEQQLRRLAVGELAARTKHGDGDGEVEAGALLASVRRREVHGDAAQRELEAAVADRGAHALARLLHRGVGQADEVHAGEARGDVDLDRHELRVEAPERARLDGREAGGRRRTERGHDRSSLPERHDAQTSTAR